MGPDNTSLAYGGYALGYRPGNPGSLFMGCFAPASTVAEISIPTIVDSTDINALNTATVIQPCADPTAGSTVGVGDPSTRLGGVAVDGDKLITTIYVYYDASVSQQAAFFVKPTTDLSKADAAGAFAIDNAAGQIGFMDGYVAPVPSAFRSKLKGPFLAGNCCIPIISRTSWGPSAFAFDPADLSLLKPAPSTALLYYSQKHPTIGVWGDTTPVDDMKLLWTGAGGYPAAVIPEGAKSILFFGSRGKNFCYGCGSAQNPLPPPDASCPEYCYDPTGSSKGVHGYPYRFQVLAYDLDDLAKVAAGGALPYDVLPYGIWDLTSPKILGFDGMTNTNPGGATYDPASKRIYFSAPNTDGDLPLVHAFQVGG